MILHVQGAEAYCYTGGKAFDAAKPAAVFIHGAQNDHSVWILQTRYFAHHGFNVLALDLPGHGRSKGPAKTSVEALAAWVLDLLDAAGLASALLGAAYPMTVSDALLDASQHDEQAAIDMVAIWSHSSMAQKPSCPGPGFSTIGGARRLMQRIAHTGQPLLFHTDFTACNAYAEGEAAARAVACPTLFLFGRRDMMTPPRATKLLTAAIGHGKIIQVDAGHQMMAEQPDAVLDALFAFATARA